MDLKEENEYLGIDIPPFELNQNIINFITITNKITRIKHKIKLNDETIKDNLEWIERYNKTNTQSFNIFKCYVKRDNYYNQFYHKRLEELENELEKIKSDLSNDVN